MYDIFGMMIAEYTSQPSNTPAPCGTCYLSTDHLGSPRLVTDGNHAVVSRHDYTPFGEEIPGWASRGPEWGRYDSVNQKFTGQERDTETQLDFFQARYFTSAQGRFTSPDPANVGTDPFDPQSWNAYAYVGNNPLARVDPTGMSWLGDLWKGISNLFNGGCGHTGSTFCITRADIDTDASFGLFGWGLGSGYTSSSSSTPPIPPPSSEVTVTANPPKTGTCSNLPAGTPPALCQALQRGLQNALNALKRASCGNFYGGQGPQTLNATQYRFIPNAPTVGAWTIPPDSGQSVSTNVFINSKGPFVTFTPTPGQQGPFGRYWTSQGQFGGFILLHELGHQLSKITGFQPDAGPQNLNLNLAQSRQVLNACF